MTTNLTQKYTQIDTSSIVLNVPLVCDVKRASELFGLSKTTLYGLAKANPDFPAKSVGRGLRFFVPDLYTWLRDYPGAIPTE